MVIISTSNFLDLGTTRPGDLGVPTNGEGDRPKPISRDIASLTTLALGASFEDLDGVESTYLDVPLGGLLRAMPGDAKESGILLDVRSWANRRLERDDLDHCSPQQSLAVKEIGVVEMQLIDRAKTYGNMKVEFDVKNQKLEIASRAMLQRQHMKALELAPDKNPRETDFFKAHVATIKAWKDEKLRPLAEAIEVYNGATRDIERQLEKMLLDLAQTAANDDVGTDGVDKDLLQELETLVEQGDDEARCIYNNTYTYTYIYTYIYIHCNKI